MGTERADLLEELRVQRLLEEHLPPARLRACSPLDVAAFSVPGEPISTSAGLGGPYTPFALGGEWGTAWGTTWFRLQGRVPEEWAGEWVYLHVAFGRAGDTGFGAEGLALDAEGRALGGLSPNHRLIRVETGPPGGGERTFFVEAAANPRAPRRQHDWPLLLPEPDGPLLYRLDVAELAIVDAEVRELEADLRCLAGLLRAGLVEGRRAGEIRRALSEAVDAIDAAGPVEGAPVARARLAGVLAAPAHASAHRVVAAGHSHIDSAWLWPLREGRRKCRRTFATAVALMEERPEYRFAASAAQHYAWVETDDPELFGRIRTQVEAGRFIPVGGFWVECDVNIPSGESLVRQLREGVRYFEEHLGVRVREGWLPDAFGYPANLPQLLRLAGLDSFLTQKLSWNEINTFPYSSFLWEGIDGSRVLTHFPPTETYNGQMSAEQLAHGIGVFAEHGRSTRSLYLFGFGDGGGGPTREMLEAAERFGDLEGAPRVELRHPRALFEELAEVQADLPVWVGELYLERHRGTYTSQARTKAGIRRAEVALREAELWAAVASCRGRSGREPLAVEVVPRVSEAWRTLLVNQFHDIAPGSSIHWVHRQAEAELAGVVATAEDVGREALGALLWSLVRSPGGSQSEGDRPEEEARRGQGDLEGTEVAETAPAVCVANAEGFTRTELAEIDPAGLPPVPDGGSGTELAVVGPDGPVLTQRLSDGRLGFLATVPAVGIRRYVVRRRGDVRPPSGPRAEIRAVEGGFVLENGRLRLAVDVHGHLASLVDCAEEREVLAGPGNVLELFPDMPVSYDAWDVDAAALRQGVEVVDLDEVVLEEGGPLRATVRIRRPLGRRSAIVERVSLVAGRPAVDLDYEVDWHERHRLLKAAFPVRIRAAEAHYECAFGLVSRPTHRNTPWDRARFEAVGHRFVDLSEPGYGVAVATDAKYGYDVAGSVLRVSLLRSPTAPDPEADQGSHRFRCRLLPHSGELGPGGVVAEARGLNDPLRVLAPPSGELDGESWSFAGVDRAQVVLETLKWADDGDGLVARCYESWGGRTEARLRLPFPVAAAERVDLLERPLGPLATDEGLVVLPIGPFEVVTVRARRAPGGA